MIGIFDSGLGGLTAVKEIRSLTPGEELVYFGDTGRVPYGTRSAETIIRYAEQDAAFLCSQNVDAIVVACGTVSTTALTHLKSSLTIPVIGVVEPSAKAAVAATRNRKIAVIGTAATIRSGAFARTIQELDPSIEVIAKACPLFVPLVESGFTSDDCQITALTCEHYLREIRESGADTLILGCTHYPIIAHHIAKALPGVTLINAGAEAAREAVAQLGAKRGTPAPAHYFVSDDPALFTASASLFLGETLDGMVEKIDIGRY